MVLPRCSPGSRAHCLIALIRPAGTCLFLAEPEGVIIYPSASMILLAQPAPAVGSVMLRGQLTGWTSKLTQIQSLPHHIAAVIAEPANYRQSNWLDLRRFAPRLARR